MKMGFSVCLTHDIDRLYKTYQYITHDVKKMKLGKLKGLASNPNPYWMIPDLLNIESKYGVKSSFFFLQETMKPTPTKPRTWMLSMGRYQFKDPKVAALIREVDEGGWDVGLHGSYNSYLDYDLLAWEKDQLEQVLGHKIVGIRQHYLNNKIPVTWQIQKKAGFVYDATYGKLDGSGFIDEHDRPFIDKETGMFVIPLAMMECYLFEQAGYNPDEAWKICLQHIDEAEKKGSVLTVLWHQRMFNENEFHGYRKVYEQLIAECKSRGAEFLTCQQLYDKPEYHTV